MIRLAFCAVLLRGVRGRAVTGCPGREVQSARTASPHPDSSARKSGVRLPWMSEERREDGGHGTDSERGRLRDRPGAD